jgi:hypothetical protein
MAFDGGGEHSRSGPICLPGGSIVTKADLHALRRLRDRGIGTDQLTAQDAVPVNVGEEFSDLPVMEPDLDPDHPERRQARRKSITAHPAHELFHEVVKLLGNEISGQHRTRLREIFEEHLGHEEDAEERSEIASVGGKPMPAAATREAARFENRSRGEDEKEDEAMRKYRDVVRELESRSDHHPGEDDYVEALRDKHLTSSNGHDHDDDSWLDRYIEEGRQHLRDNGLSEDAVEGFERLVRDWHKPHHSARDYLPANATKGGFGGRMSGVHSHLGAHDEMLKRTGADRIQPAAARAIDRKLERALAANDGKLAGDGEEVFKRLIGEEAAAHMASIKTSVSR